MRIRDSNKGKYLRVWEWVTACVPRKDSGAIQCGPAEYACAQGKRNGKAQQLCCGGDRNRAGGPCFCWCCSDFSIEACVSMDKAVFIHLTPVIDRKHQTIKSTFAQLTRPHVDGYRSV
jgi:hypothetical protein